MKKTIDLDGISEIEAYRLASTPTDPPSQIDLVEYYTQEFRKAIRAHKRQVWSRRIWIGLYACSFLSAFGILGRSFGEYWWLWILFAGGAAAGTGWKRKELAWALADSNDLRAVNILAIAALDGDGDTRDVATMGLMKLLPLFRHSNASILTNEGMTSLIALLDQARPALLAIIITALEQVGDERAIPAVERLSSPFAPGSMSRGQWKAWLRGTNDEWEQVRDAARECLPSLQNRVEHKRISSILLRAAQEPGAADQTLLRPAASTEVTEEQLLRPAI